MGPYPTTFAFLMTWITSGCFVDVPEVSEFEDTSTGRPSSSSADAVSTASGSSLSATGAGSSIGDESTSMASSDDSSGSTSSASSSTGNTYAYYGWCTNDDDSQCLPDEVCLWTDGVVEGIEPTGFCGARCNEPGDCPPPPEGSDAEMTCTYYCGGTQLRCMLRCPNGETCPEGQQCLPRMELPECAGWYIDICV